MTSDYSVPNFWLCTVGLPHGYGSRGHSPVFSNSSRVVAFLGLPLPQDLRLRYATSIYRSGPTTLWTLMAADKGWLHCFQEAFHWMLENLKGYGPDSQGNDWSCNFDSWCQRDPS